MTISETIIYGIIINVISALIIDFLNKRTQK